jgi:chemotaxis protein MotB
MGDKRPIIIIKKKSAHAGHHGGAWKVAYADFVTAMMALFIVLWLTSSGEKVKKSIAGYFNDPSGKAITPGSDLAGDAESLPVNKDNVKDLKERLEQQIARRPDLKALANQIEIAITPEGMRIELIESTDGSFFESGSAVLSAKGKELLNLLAKELGTVPNRVSMEGHTDAQPYTDQTKYDNWELSVDRANAARRVMQGTGLYLGQVDQVRGFADQQLRNPTNPLDPSNRRVTVIVHYLTLGPVPAGFHPGKPSPVPKAGLSAEGQAADAASLKGKTVAAIAETSKKPADISAATASRVTTALPALPDRPLAKPSAVQSLLKKLPTMSGPNSVLGKVTLMFSKKKPVPAPPAAPQVKP